MFERLTTTATALSQRVDRITVQEFVDCSGIAEPAMLVELMGMGKPPEAITVDAPMFRAVSKQYEQALGAAAEVMHCRVDRVEPSIEVVTAPADIPLRATTIRAGTVAGQKLIWTAYRDDAPVLVAEEYWTVTDQIPSWNITFDGKFRVRAIIEGVPNIQLELQLTNGDIEGLPQSSQGQLAVGMTAVRAIEDVMAAPPGTVVTPKVFAAYRWPD